jgi:hypothetical protein
VVAAHEVPAGIAAPERQTAQVGPVRVNLASVRQASINIPAATAAVNTPNPAFDVTHNGGYTCAFKFNL